MKPVKILQVTGGLNRAGVETWLMHVLRHIDRERFHMDFLVHGKQQYDYEAEAVSLGANVIRCLEPPRRPWVYVPALRRVLREYGPYDVVHTHVHDFSGVVLKVADWAGVPMRVAHSHSDTISVDAQASVWRRVYLEVSRRWIRQHCTLGLAVSGASRDALFGTAKSGLVRVLPCSIDCTPFRGEFDVHTIRGRLGIPKDAYVIGHVGGFRPEKNHEFFVRIAAEILRMESRAWFLMVGDGPLRPRIEGIFSGAGIADRSTFLGVSEIVPRLMRGAMDVFVLPSLYEGLPLVLLEAQAAGLPCVFSSTVAREADVVPPLIQRMPPTESAAEWARSVIGVVHASPSISKSRALELIEASCFGHTESVKKLEKIYVT